MNKELTVLGRKSRIVYRIKNEETGEYYKDTNYLWKSTIDAILAKAPEQVNEWDKRVLEQWESPYKTTDNNNSFKIMLFDPVGKLYSTERGAQNMCSQLTKCSYKDRKTPAGMILKAKYNFKVVKTEVIFKDYDVLEKTVTIDI